MQIRPTAFTIGLIIHSFIALFFVYIFVYTEFGIDSKWQEHDRLFTKWDGQPMHPNTPYTWLMRECERNTKGMFSWIGFHKKGIWYQQKERQSGKSKWGLKSLMNLALNGITSYTIAPLRLATTACYGVSDFGRMRAAPDC